MSAGDKVELITIERETLAATPSGGGQTVSWSTIGWLWAEPRYVRGGEKEANGALREINVYRFLVWSEAVRELAITVADVIVWNGERYAIRETPRRLRGSVDTEIIAETGVPL